MTYCYVYDLLRAFLALIEAGEVYDRVDVRYKPWIST